MARSWAVRILAADIQSLSLLKLQFGDHEGQNEARNKLTSFRHMSAVFKTHPPSSDRNLYYTRHHPSLRTNFNHQEYCLCSPTHARHHSTATMNNQGQAPVGQKDDYGDKGTFPLFISASLRISNLHQQLPLSSTRKLEAASRTRA